MKKVVHEINKNALAVAVVKSVRLSFCHTPESHLYVVQDIEIHSTPYDIEDISRFLRPNFAIRNCEVYPE